MKPKREGEGELFVTDLPGTRYTFVVKGHAKLFEDDSSAGILMHVSGFQRPVIIILTWLPNKGGEGNEARK